MQSCRVQQESGCSTKLGIPEGPQLAGSGRELDPGDSALSWARVPVFGERARKAGARVEQRVAKHHQERQEGRASSRRLERPLWERGLKAEGEAPSGRETASSPGQRGTGHAESEHSGSDPRQSAEQEL